MKNLTALVLFSGLGLCACGGAVDEGVVGTPAEPAWVVAASMNHPRTNHCSVRLDDGRVMVFGGYGVVKGQQVPIASVEVYDPIADVWSDLLDMQVKRADFAATLLPDGTVLLTGGMNEYGQYLDKAEIYDPASGQVGGLISMRRAHLKHTATLLADKGRVLVVGGRGDYSLDIAEMFDVATKTFGDAPDRADNAHHAHTATLLPSGQVLIVGGYDPFGPLNVIARVNPRMFDASFWYSSPMTMDARTSHLAAALPERCPDGSKSPEAGNVIVAGGEGFSAVRFDDAWIIDWESDQLREMPSRMAEARSHAAGAMMNTYYVVSGGLDATLTALKGAERFDPCSGAWSSLSGMKFARSGHTADSISRGRVMVAGGSAKDSVLGTAEILWPNADCSSQFDCSEGNSCSAAGFCMKQN